MLQCKNNNNLFHFSVKLRDKQRLVSKQLVVNELFFRLPTHLQPRRKLLGNEKTGDSKLFMIPKKYTRTRFKCI